MNHPLRRRVLSDDPSRRSWVLALLALTFIAVSIPVYWLHWGGFGYASYCGTPNADQKRAARETPAQLAREDSPTPPPASPERSEVSGDCTFSCSTDAEKGPAPDAKDGVAMLRRCKAEVRAQQCSLNLALVGEKLDARLVLTDVVVSSLRIERSELRGIVGLGCSFKPTKAGDLILVRDSTLSSELVLRAAGVPDQIAQPEFIEPRGYGDEPKDCEPKSRLKATEDVELPVFIERIRVGTMIDFELLSFKKSVSVRNATIGGVLLLDRTTFRERADFQGTAARTISAAGAEFLGDARLFRMSAEGDAWFECAEFHSPLNMLGFGAGGIVNMRRVRFTPAQAPALDAGSAVALDGVRARGVDLTAAAANARVSLADADLEWLSLANFTSTKPLLFNGGKIAHLLIYKPSWFAIHPDSPIDLTQTGAFPGYWTDGLETVSVGSIEPDEAAPPRQIDSVDVRFTHVLQFLRNSDHSLGTYDVAARTYHENGKALWESHIAFCAAAQKTNPLLTIAGRVRHFSPEVPALLAVLLLVGQVLWLRRCGIRPIDGEFLQSARALVEAAVRSAPQDELTVLRQRLLRTPVESLPPGNGSAATSGQSYASLTTELKPVEHALAVALLEKEASYTATHGREEWSTLGQELARAERFFDACPTRNFVEVLRFAVATTITFIDFGPAREFEIALPGKRYLLMVVRTFWSLLLAWVASIVFSYFT